MNKRYVLVTGATGFIGRNLCAFFKKKGYFVRGSVRDSTRDVSGADEYIQVGDINSSTDWTIALQGVDFVVHLAGRAHVMDDRESDPASEYYRINVLGTKRLAEQAAKSGVKRFIFVSSIKVNGEESVLPYTENDVPHPKDAYGISKLETEKVLADISSETGLKTIVLRLPLVYGPGVKANFLQLIRLIDKEIPLPFGSIHNNRSFIYIGNLCDIIELCFTHPAVNHQLFLVSDGQDLSTPQLVSIMAEGLQKKAILFSCPLFLLRIIGLLTGKSDAIRRLTVSLCVQTAKFTTLTGWSPRFSVEEGIAETVRFYRIQRMKRVFDLILSSVLLAILFIPILVIAFLIKISSKGPVIFWTDRIGVNNTIFKMAKFRTMKVNTPQVATHLMKNPENYLTSIGVLLRRYSLDEIPQIFNILKGDMSFVGPRPALFNQGDLIELRTKKNVHTLIPGVTGWAQINGRDDIPIPLKVEFDEYYLKNKSLVMDIKIMLITVLKVIKKEGIKH